MKTKLFFLLFAITCFFLISSLQSKPRKTDENVNKIIYQTGINSLIYLPSQDIIPSFRNVMPIVPDSVWGELSKIFDTTSVFLDLERRIKKEFPKIEIDCIAKLIDLLLSNTENPIDTSRPQNFDRTTWFFNSIDSLLNVFDNIEGLGKDAGKTSDAFGKKTKRKEKAKIESPLSSADSLFLQSLTTSQRYFEKALEEMLSAQKEYLKSLNSMVKYYLETNKDLFKEFLLQAQRAKEREERLKPHKVLDSINRKLLHQFEQKNKRTLEEFQEQKEKLLKELENLKNQLQSQNKDFYGKLRRGELYRSKPNQTEANCLNKDLLKKLNKFLNKLLNFRKEYDQKILDELKQRGFIIE
ncbi:MAG: hypothetical protein ACUVQ1_09170 [Candidatus Kapaibacteriales bacterium]